MGFKLRIWHNCWGSQANSNLGGGGAKSDKQRLGAGTTTTTTTERRHWNRCVRDLVRDTLRVYAGPLLRVAGSQTLVTIVLYVLLWLFPWYTVLCAITTGRVAFVATDGPQAWTIHQIEHESHHHAVSPLYQLDTGHFISMMLP